MRAWHEGIYGNEDAQDFLKILQGIYEESEDLNDFLTLSRNHSFNKYANCRFVLADLETEFDGEIYYYQDVLSMIDSELKTDALNYWINPDKREKVLKGFKEVLSNRLDRYNPHDLLTFYDIPNWIEEKVNASIFESTI